MHLIATAVLALGLKPPVSEVESGLAVARLEK